MSDDRFVPFSGPPPYDDEDGVTVQSHILEQILPDPKWARSRRWWQFYNLVVSTPSRTWALRTADAPLPPDVTAIGCSGVDESKALHYVNLKFNVGCGEVCYPDIDSALKDARMLRRVLGARLEIRRSRSGCSLYLRHDVSSECLHARFGPMIATHLVERFCLRADPRVSAHQCLWLWTAAPQPGAFELVEADGSWPCPLDEYDAWLKQPWQRAAGGDSWLFTENNVHVTTFNSEHGYKYRLAYGATKTDFDEDDLDEDYYEAPRCHDLSISHNSFSTEDAAKRAALDHLKIG